MFWSKREDVATDWRRLHNEKRHDLHVSSIFIRVTKSRRIR
jgi:hypothetical protein